MGRGRGKGGDDTMWLISVAMCPIGIALVICAAVIQPWQGMTPEIALMLYIIGGLSMFLSMCINYTLRRFFPVDTDDLAMALKRTMKERKQLARRHEKRRNLKSALQVSIPGFEDVKIRPKVEDISDSDKDSSSDGDVDPESRW